MIDKEWGRPGRHFFLFFLPPFLPSSLWAAELVRGFFLPSFLALAFAFFAVSLPLPVFCAMPGPLPGAGRANAPARSAGRGVRAVRQRRSNRSSSMTFTHAATKSR